MSRWLPTIRNGAMTLALAATLANCGSDSGNSGGGGGGGNTIQLYFGINGEGSCNSVIVNVDLADAEAILARAAGGGPQCSIDGLLAAGGCTATFTEIGAGQALRVSISGCTIPAVTNLFQCTFTHVDISAINSESIAQCVCAVAGCDGGPPLCIDADPDPRSCEDCSNRIDDDDDGLEDCEDPNCEHSPECAATTTTTSTTVSTTPSTSGTTTSTTLFPPQPIEINFFLDQTIDPLGALQFTVNYTSAPGRFVGDGTAVECDSKVEGLFSANASDATSKLKLGFVSLDGLDDPLLLATCLFDPDTPVPVPANFTIVIDDASDLDGNRVRNVIVNTTVTGVPD
jgi:hypothetical protein